MNSTIHMLMCHLCLFPMYCFMKLKVMYYPWWQHHNKLDESTKTPTSQVTLIPNTFHSNQASHSRDKIWPWKFKVKGKGKCTPVSVTCCWLISLVFHIRASNRLPSPSFHDNRASHSRDTIWPWKFKVIGRISPKFNQVESMIRGIFLLSFVTIGWAVLTLSWGKGKLHPALVA